MSARTWLVALPVFAFAAPARSQGATPVDEMNIQVAVLRWLAPPRGQMRWLDARLAPSDGNNSAPAMSVARLDSIVARLGNGFERWNDSLDADPRPGGVILLSDVLRFAPDSAAVRVRYRQRSRYVAGAFSDLMIVVTRKKGEWTVVKP